jgi:glycerol-3-phosphate dehydrogenase
MIETDASQAEKIHKDYPYTKAEVWWMIKNEMAITVEDILARRIRLLFLDAKAAMEAAPAVATIMAKEMNKDDQWIKEQIDSFKKLATGYIITDV